MQVQSEDELLGVAQVAVAKEQPESGREARHQHEHRRAPVGGEPLAHEPEVLDHGLRVEHRALLQTSAQPGRQAFADEAAVLDRDACDADVEIERRRSVLEQLGLFGIDGRLHRHHQAQREQDRDAHGQVEPQR